MREASRLPRYSVSRSTPWGYPARRLIYQRWRVAKEEFWTVLVSSGRSAAELGG